MTGTDTGPLVARLPACDDPPRALALLRELAEGRPTAADDLRWSNVELDGHGRVVAFSGLSLTPTAHRFELGGRRLYAWCAWDTLFLPALLERSARVTSRCAVTGETVRLTVEPAGVIAVDPEPLWVSFPPPSARCDTDLAGSFCPHVHFLAGRAAVDRWLSEHAGGTALPLQDAFELGRAATRCFSG